MKNVLSALTGKDHGSAGLGTKRLHIAEHGGCGPSSSSSSSAHALRYFFTGVSEPGQGLPEFIIVGYLDDQRFVQYDSHTRRDLPQTPWIEEAEKDDPYYWDWQTHLSRNWELFFRVSLWSRHNDSHGLHTWQWMHGCELSKEGRKRGYSQFAYDGKDYLSLDKETLTWTATDSRAQVTKRRWDTDRVWTEGRRNFVEGRCVEWLQKYLDYGKETLLRREPPVVRVGRRVAHDGLERLVCRAYGFYPREIDAVWKKDGEVWWQDAFHGGVVPNADGTYHTWISVTIDPKDRARYRCHVEHDSLPEPVELAWEEAASVWPIVGGIVGAAAVVLLAVGIVFLNPERLGLGGWRRNERRPTQQHQPDCLLEPLEGVG
ncbi:PREDICTED: major histocompatibility complex class I-related gene protein-like [Gekko japonicus]|uniref:Major histocompatibility complex class I-related gene protein-like n=2 Tax=Gekko japonicus TaxID=146911 RepID=A0ABM1JT58_GEKJA|nr:PREDICTED: major histocompatibility complex class I-related gene protein-like [Gekko japonicus]